MAESNDSPNPKIKEEGPKENEPPEASSSSSSQPASKQRRILSPCVNCRRRKRKCTGDRPICQFCRKNNLICEWTEVSKRGPRKGYIDELETKASVADGALKVLREFLGRIPRAQWPALRYEDYDHDGDEDEQKVFEQFKEQFGVANLSELCQWYEQVTRVPGRGGSSTQKLDAQPPTTTTSSSSPPPPKRSTNGSTKSNPSASKYFF